MFAESRPTKIAYVALSYTRSGTEQIILELSERFIRDRASVMVVIPTGSEGLDRMADDAHKLGVPVERVAPLYPGDRDRNRSLYELYHLLRRWRPSIVHFHIPRALSGFESVLAAWLARVPRRIRTDHNPVVNRPTQLERLRLRMSDSMVDRIVLVSTDNLANHREQVHRPAGKCLMIPNGVDPSAIVCCCPPERRTGLRIQLGLPPDDQVAVMVAALEERKGAFDYIKAAQVASTLVPSLRYAVLGDGQVLPAMKRMADELGILDRVHFLGRRDDVRQILHVFDQFVLPSHYEGMALTMLEALAAGLPMVTTRVDGVSDVLPGEYGALFADKHDADGIGVAMARLATDASLRAQLSAVSRERVRRDFTIEAVYQRYRSLYRQLGVLAA